MFFFSDTETRKQILNITFSKTAAAATASEGSGSGIRQTFLLPDYIRQKLYLHSAQLEKLTQLKYLAEGLSIVIPTPKPNIHVFSVRPGQFYYKC